MVEKSTEKVSSLYTTNRGDGKQIQQQQLIYLQQQKQINITDMDIN